MELGQEIDDFLARMKAETGDEFALVIKKKYLDEQAWASTRGERRNGWNDDPGAVTVNVTSADAPIAGSSADIEEVPQSGRYLAPVEIGLRVLVRGVVPVTDAAGQRVGGLFVLHDVTALRQRGRDEQLRVLVLIGVVAVAVLALLFGLFEVLVFRRLEKMTSAIERVSTRLAGGDYDVGATIHPTSADELGRFEAFLGRFLGTIGTTLRELEKRQRGGRS
jgi:HAMP domain-containing protein